MFNFKIYVNTYNISSFRIRIYYRIKHSSTIFKSSWFKF